MVFTEKGFDSRAQQEMSCLSSDWSCGLDNLFLSQRLFGSDQELFLLLYWKGEDVMVLCCYCNQVFAGLLREFCLTGVCIAVKGIGGFGTCGYWM
ncbi:hypothetical protein OIU84_028253 [Salix udensis]|uniref:Uncharacterized protein n=1 Tax=Salix udensis TaxID=889485 RepID=A0AAD6KCM0_9ROSI|nr:hypothetical protein OIU84_028253 [Salix udensis]